MIIIINELVKFNEDDFTLSMVDEPESYIKLQPITALVLSALIEKNNSIISREELLENVWVGRGYTPSNPSLNNSIASIRKSYQTLTDNELHLKTLPKIGYEFHCSIRKIKDSHSNEIVKNELTPTIRHVKYYINPARITFLLFMVIINLSWAYHIFSVEKPLKFNIKSYKKIDKVGGCDIYSYNASPNNDDYERKFKNNIDFKGCSNTINNSIDVFIDLNTQGDKYKFYTWCIKRNNSTYEQCINYKISHTSR